MHEPHGCGHVFTPEEWRRLRSVGVTYVPAGDLAAGEGAYAFDSVNCPGCGSTLTCEQIALTRATFGPFSDRERELVMDLERQARARYERRLRRTA
jgi:hypothetical protein